MNNQKIIEAPVQGHQTWQSEITEYFGPLCWRHCFGDIYGKIPCLPGNLEEILAKPCKINPGKTVGESHKVVLMPKNTTNYCIFFQKLFSSLIETKQLPVCTLNGIIEEMHWCLVTKEFVPGTIKAIIPSSLTRLEYNQNDSSIWKSKNLEIYYEQREPELAYKSASIDQIRLVISAGYTLLSITEAIVAYAATILQEQLKTGTKDQLSEAAQEAVKKLTITWQTFVCPSNPKISLPLRVGMHQINGCSDDENNEYSIIIEDSNTVCYSVGALGIKSLSTT